MFARGRAVVSAWWVGWWCWNIPSKRLLSKLWQRVPCKHTCSRKKVLLGGGSDPHHNVGLFLSLILPPFAKGDVSSLWGCYWMEVPGLNPAVGWKDAPCQQELHMCLEAAGEASVHSSSLVALAQVVWLCLPLCLLSAWKRGWVLLTKSHQCPCVTLPGGFPWARSFLWVLVSAWRIAAGRVCTWENSALLSSTFWHQQREVSNYSLD